MYICLQYISYFSPKGLHSPTNEFSNGEYTQVNTLVFFFNATFNNISVISQLSVLLVEETTDLPQVADKLYHIMLY
jgi:hypothetical protein